MDERFQQRVISLHNRRECAQVFRFQADNPPPETRKAAVGAVWKKYTDVNCKWAQYYWSCNGIASPYYIPSDVWFSKLCRKLNSLDRFGWPQFQDKNYLDLLFRDVRQPEIVVRNVAGQLLDRQFNAITLKEAIALCLREAELLVKPSISSKGGRGIAFLGNAENPATEDTVAAMFSERGNDFSVQRVLRQHSKLAALNPDSINSIRVQTLLWKGKVYVLSALVRVGVKGCRVDNPHASDGVSCVLTPEGAMVQTAYDRNWRSRPTLPNGEAPGGLEIPFYDQIIETVRKLQYRVPHSRLVGWDMSVSEDGEPILIEANLDYPEVYFHQLGKGPIIWDPVLFDDVMEYVFHK
ncbi:MAG: hypothetical protein IKP82_01320 [Oscillospiraceae bacterium]|nr:hypothetical protein [Oscillospiraceae bacterium]